MHAASVVAGLGVSPSAALPSRVRAEWKRGRWNPAGPAAPHVYPCWCTGARATTESSSVHHHHHLDTYTQSTHPHSVTHQKNSEEDWGAVGGGGRGPWENIQTVIITCCIHRVSSNQWRDKNTNPIPILTHKHNLRTRVTKHFYRHHSRLCHPPPQCGGMTLFVLARGLGPGFSLNLMKSLFYC